jgi:nickel transport protein
MKVKQWIFVLTLLLGFLLNPGTASAHVLQANYQVLAADSLEVQGVFSTGEFYEGAPVVIYSPKDPKHPWLTGLADRDGKFDFHPDQSIAGNWSIEIGKGQHWDQLFVPVTDHGINGDLISYLDGNRLHRNYDVASQVVIAVVALVSGLLGHLFSRKFKHQHWFH